MGQDFSLQNKNGDLRTKLTKKYRSPFKFFKTDKNVKTVSEFSIETVWEFQAFTFG